MVLTTAGGWGVVTADAVTKERGLELMALPDDLRDAIDAKLPPRWSRNNPVDCAGGETRDTIPEVMELIAGHPDVHAIIYLGVGIQSNQARMMREGGFYPGHGLDRIVAYHERQDARFAEAAAELSDRTGKPILVASELAVADPANPGPAAVRASGRLCYPSGERAAVALGHLRRYAAYRERRRVVSRRRVPAIDPVAVIVVLAAIPAFVLWSVWNWAGDKSEAADAAPPTSTTIVPPPAPLPALNTPLGSLRRASPALARDLNLEQFRAAAQPLLGAVNERSCVALSVDGYDAGSANPDRRRAPGQHREARRRRRRPRGLGRDVHVHDPGRRTRTRRRGRDGRRLRGRWR